MAYRSSSNQKTRTLDLGTKPKQREEGIVTQIHLTTIMLACSIEGCGIYIKETRSGDAAKVKVYLPDESVDFYIDLVANTEVQVQRAVEEIWGPDTYREARALLQLGTGQRPQEARKAARPTQTTS